MIRIFDKEERYFDHLGLGSLDESIAAVVVEELKGGFELEIEYPINGRHFDKIQHKNIIFCKPNMHTSEQPFRIYGITKPFEGRVTINAEHISYDASGVTILPKRNEDNEIESYGTKVTVGDDDGYYLDTILADINNSAAVQGKNYFVLSRDPLKENEFKKEGYSIPLPMNLRSMLGGSENSILEVFKCEYLFDKYNIILKEKRGMDRGITIRYGKNMTNLEQETDASNMFTAIFPFYSKAYTETFTTTTPIFQEAYIIKDITPLRADWLSIELVDVSKGIGGISLKPVIEVMKIIVDGVEGLVERYAPIRVKTPNNPETPGLDFYDKIYIFRKNTVEAGNLVNAYATQTAIINDKEVITELKLNLEDVNPIVPEFGIMYNILGDTSPFFNRKFIYDKNAYVEYFSEGFYVEAKDATLVSESTPLQLVIPTYPISWDPITSSWIQDNQNGSIYVRPIKPNVGTKSVDKYVYQDLLDFELPENSESILENGVLYVNEELKELDNQKVLTLDLTSEIDDIPNLKPEDITKEHIFNKAEQYLKDNDFTKMKESITISFIKLSDSPEYEHFKDLEIVELGDEVSVIYEKLGVNSKHRVISTEYNVLSNSYNEIELGDIVNKITNNVISRGDNLSALKNDTNYVNKTYVVDFVAENADIINAQIQNAIIKTLEASNVNISGLLTASHATLDQLVASMLIADNAKIREMLEAGSVRVTGKIVALSGEIGGAVIEDGVLKVPAAQIDGILTIGQLPDTVAEVNDIPTAISELENDSGYQTETGVTTIIDGRITTDYIEALEIEVAAAKITGQLEASQIKVEDIVITNSIVIGGTPESPNFHVDTFGNVTIKQGSININDEFIVDTDGNVTAKSISITGGEIVIGDPLDPTFMVENNGKMTAKDAVVEGDITIKEGSIKIGGTPLSPNFQVDTLGNVIIKQGSIDIGGHFTVNSTGDVIIGAGSINIGLGAFSVTNLGKLYAEGAEINGTFITDKIDVTEVVFDDVISLKKSTAVATETQTVNFTGSANSLYLDGDNATSINVSVIANKATWYNQNVTVFFTYYQSDEWGGFVGVNDSITVTVLAGTTSRSSGKIVYGPITGFNYTGRSPSSVVETRTLTNLPALDINAHLYPSSDTTNIDLGASDRRFNNIYLKNNPIVSSDERMKKEINYDILSYEQLFDKLKPALYKMKDGTSDRIHMGFIAQDIRDALIELGIDSKDFAAFIRGIRSESVDKPIEDLTEDDYIYGIRYSELHALQVQQIQKLKHYITLLEERIQALEEKVGDSE